MPAIVHQFMCLEDNFGVLVHDPATGATASIDAPEAGPVLNALSEKGWTLTHILVTHHHKDHIGGVDEVRARFPDAIVVGPAPDKARVPGADVYLGEGEEVMVGSLRGRVIETPGHTSGHVVYHFPKEKLLFAGDTLFAMGCGRAFEKPAQVLYESAMKLAALPGDTQVYCGHEYTLSNARFAVKVDPDNEALKSRLAQVEQMRAAGEATLPTSIAVEHATNPFFRAADPAVQKTLGMEGAAPADVFAELRERKNRG
ncbi:MAG: hydroxyacylglutathione hydrolase [Beijerinckiaceae bacterium]|nr:hydroxyacylglutathione hydrolase [Beijerinckiaceae bacterium]